MNRSTLRSPGKQPGDWRERDQARDPEHSYIVQAPAGSGKTELLTQRMLGLLARVEHPEEVIAITFTRKAAAEMSHRLVRRLQATASEPKKELEPHEQISRDLALAVLKRDTERGWNLLEQPSRLRIRTIDGLCSEIARQLPILSGLGGSQQISKDPESLYRAAAERTMAVIEDDSDSLHADLVRVLDRYDNQYDRLVELLTSMLGRREQWIGHLLDIRTGNGFDREGLEDGLRLLIEAELRSTRENIPDELLTELPRFLNYALSNLPLDETRVKALLNACGGPGCGYLDLPVAAGALEHWVTVIGYLLTKSGGWWANAGDSLGFPAPSNATGEEKRLRKHWKDGYKVLLDSVRGNEDLLARFNTIRKLPRPGYDEEAWLSLESLIRILIRASQEWHLVMSETGQTDFSEIATRAIEALGRDDVPSNLALRMDYRIQHLLVDEFQDTSLSQIHLLDKLTTGWSEGDGRTLFLVGDPMQSIYRFRKAEVSLFIQAFDGQLFRHIKLQPLQLQVNFRSTRPVVDWVNRIFPDVLPRHSDPMQDAVHYSESCTRPDALPHGTVATHILPARDDREEARRIVELIGQSDPSQKLAILVRSRNHASEILALLDRIKEEDSRFRYQAIAFNPLAETPLIQDLVSLTLALTQPADRLAWFSVLRAPFSGLDLADLDELSGGNPDGIVLNDMTARLEQNAAGSCSLSVTGLQRLRRIAPALSAASRRRGRESVRTMVESAWNGLGGPACVHNASELIDAATYFDLLDSMEDENLAVDRDTLAQRMKDLYTEPDALASDSLQVMTIYAAKGLQFDTVILPGLNRGTGNDKGRLLHWFELAGQNRIVMSPMRNTGEKLRQKSEGDLVQFISDVENRRQSLENGRLLYVATTRAIHSLHLFAAVTPAKDGVIKPGSGTLLRELWPAIQAEQAPRILTAAPGLQDSSEIDEDGDPVSDTATFPQEYRRLSAAWQLPVPPAAVLQSAADLPEPRDYIEFRWAGEDTRLTGNLVHRLLQEITEQGLQQWLSGDGNSQRENWCRQQLLCEGVQGAKADAIVGRVALAIDNCLGSECGKWLLESHEASECEYPLTAVLENQPRNLVLDRTFIDKDTRWIIDYKTSSHGGGDLEGFLQNEAERYREQMQRYRKAVAINESRPIRTALYFPLLDRFIEL
jgi:ATP-dependent exoDNAse (exonuclease V) beta subunit